MPHALVVDDDSGFQEAVGELISQEGFTIEQAGSLKEAREILAQRLPDVALLDLTLPDGPGSELLSELAQNATTDVVLITGRATVDSAVQALREGATDYLVKQPEDLQRLRAVLGNVARRCELSEEVRSLRDELRGLGRFGPMIGSSASMQKLYDEVSRVAPTNAAVLITGESGTGKELVAETVHRLSRRRKERFVALNCGAVSPQLIESELFGHEKGSFTGASRTHRGYFERAAGGTLFLDEITEMPLELQVKLLRVLETGMVTRVGAEQETPIDVRIIAASNRDLNAAVEQSKLRQDLVYRLAVFPIRLPPLRERGPDVHLLAEYFLAELNRVEQTEKRFTRAALEMLRSHSWPGNVRELKNVVERAFIMADRDIDRECVPIADASPVAASEDAATPSPTSSIQLSPGMSIDEAERRLILATLEACDGNKEKAAGILKISLKTLYNRLNEYNYNGRTRRRRDSRPPIPEAAENA